MNNIQSIISGDIDLYEFLDISPNALPLDIRTKYRRLALLYHPDKNDGEITKFTLLSQVYQILSNEDLRSKYDHIRSLPQHEDSRADSIERFRKALERDELSAKKTYTPVNLDLLLREGLEKRRQLELKSHRPVDYISFEQIKVPNVFSFAGSNELLVKWKHKDELQGLFDEEVLKEIMLIFGELKSCRLTGTSSKYDTGVVEFLNLEDAKKALGHDYKKSGTIWDNTKVRKLASLLRDCEMVPEDVLEVAINRFESR